jgi:transcriptional regulator with XRE-family HTH domain
MSAELGDFLRTRRARVRPEDAGLRISSHPPRRRVPGLRREELALLAGVSVDYYVRLEQGRAGHPSESVLEALARALQLDETEQAHLHELARPPRPRRRRRRRPRVRPELRRLLERMDGIPAFVLGPRMDVLAWNPLAAAMMGDFGALAPHHRNIPRHVFLDPGSRRLYPEWKQIARETVAYLRMEAGRDPDDAELAELVGELSLASPEFARWWADHDVYEKTHGTKRIDHPEVGEMTLHYETLVLPDQPGQTLVTYTAEPGSPSDTALRLLATLAAQTPSTPRSESHSRT